MFWFDGPCPCLILPLLQLPLLWMLRRILLMCSCSSSAIVVDVVVGSSRRWQLLLTMTERAAMAMMLKPAALPRSGRKWNPGWRTHAYYEWKTGQGVQRVPFWEQHHQYLTAVAVVCKKQNSSTSIIMPSTALIPGNPTFLSMWRRRRRGCSRDSRDDGSHQTLISCKICCCRQYGGGVAALPIAIQVLRVIDSAD